MRSLRLIIFRFQSFLVRRHFISNDNRIVLKPKALLLTFLLVIAAIYGIDKLLNNPKMSFEYDLMLDVATSQNISNSRIICSSKRINDTFSINKIFIDNYFLKLDMLAKRNASYKKQFSSISYSLDLKDEKNNGE